DYARIDAAYAAQGSQAGVPGPLSPYRNGDINYSGSVNSDDFFEIDRAFATQSSPLSTVSPGLGTLPAEPAAITTERFSPRGKRHHHRRHHVNHLPDSHTTASLRL